MTNSVTINNSTLLSKIIQKQNAEGLNDYAFADKLIIERSTWTHIRLGRRKIGLTLLRAILRTYPELTDDVIAFMHDGDYSQSNKPPKLTISSQPAPVDL